MKVILLLVFHAVAGAQQVSAPKPVATLKAGDTRDLKDGQRYVYIPEGTFRMGCSEGDTECQEAEKPVRQIRISKGFWIGQTEATVGAYKRFAQATGKQAPVQTSDNLPMNNVNWEEARDYCVWAGLRLPTEAEWEYAARAGAATARYGEIGDIAWYSANSTAVGSERTSQTTSSGRGVKPVAQKRANAFGLFDMLGNVNAWTADWYSEEAYADSVTTDPKGPATSTARVVRGGSWFSSPDGIRLSSRNGVPQSYRSFWIGFRCVGEALIP